MHEVNQYVRFQKNPPEKKPPPKGQVDLYFDPTTGELVKQTDAGMETEFTTGISADTVVNKVLSNSVSGFADLKAVSTTGLTVGYLVAYSVDFDFSGSHINTVVLFMLDAGTDAENVAEGIIRPDDYAASTNEKVWRQATLSAQNFVTSSITLRTEDGLNSGVFRASNISAVRLYETPNANGTFALTSQTDGSITPADLTIAAYADDAAAATGGVAVGDIYRKTDGTVVWRQS